MFSVRLLVVAVMLLCFVKELGKRGDVDLPRWRRFPFAAGKSRLDLLEQVTVPVRILERCKRKVGTTLWIAATDARVFSGVVKWATSVLKHLADVCAATNQVLSSRLDVVHREGQALHRARLGRRHSVAKNYRGLRIGRCELNDSELLALYEIGVEPPAEFLVERFRTIDIRNANHHDFELHIHRFSFVVAITPPLRMKLFV